MPGLKEVSRRCGVSVSTVSRYLSGTLKVLPGTREKIEEAVRSTGYQPNYIARSLKMKCTKIVGILSPTAKNAIFAEMLEGISELLGREGYACIHVISQNDPHEELRGASLLHSKLADGAIVLSGGLSLEEYRSSGLKNMVFVNCLYNEPGVSRVLCDYEAGGRAVMQRFLAMGRTRIALLGGLWGREETQVKLQGCLHALSEAGVQNVGIGYGAYQYAEGYAAMERLLQSSPTAVYAVNDIMAVAAIRCIQDHGLRVPNEIAVIGCGNSEAAGYVRPSLTTLDQQKEQVGLKAAELLLSLLRGEAPQTVALDTHIVERESC